MIQFISKTKQHYVTSRHISQLLLLLIITIALDLFLPIGFAMIWFAVAAIASPCAYIALLVLILVTQRCQ